MSVVIPFILSDHPNQIASLVILDEKITIQISKEMHTKLAEILASLDIG